MRKLFLTLSFTVAVASVWAVPAKRGIWKTVKLADGTEVKVERRGDEFCSYWQTEGGRKFVKNSGTGLYETADVEALEAKTAQKRNTAQTLRANRSQKMRVESGADHITYTGAKKGLIILVRFSDVSFGESHTLDLYKRIANDEGFTSETGFQGSVRDYFKDQSLGQLDLQFDVAGPVTMLNGYAYYGAPTNGSEDNDAAVAQMVIDACNAVDDDIDFSEYDWDGDGEADQVFILYAGHGEASYDDENTIWPHMWELSSALKSYQNIPYLDGVYINAYACSCELGSGDEIDGIGTICHEFSHCLGLPDMYDTSGSGNYGMDLWDLMDYGNYNGDGFIPANYTSYERMYCGWQQPIELTEDRYVEGMEAIGDGGDTYIIYNDGHQNEYYLLENRQLSGWDAGLPNSGLLILHVDYNASAWYYNIVNSTSIQRCTIFHADNSDAITFSGLKNDIYPYGDNNSLTNTSSPAATLNNANTDGSYYMNKLITEITKHDDGTISFTFGAPESSDIGVTTAERRKDGSRIFSIDGRYLGNDVNALKKGIYIINGRKYIK